MTDHADRADATQDAPLMKQNDPTIDEALEGIAVQTRADVERSPNVQARELLRQRLQETGITVDDATFEELLHRVSSTETLDPQPGTTR